MVNNKIAQRAVAAGLSGLMAFGAAAPAALATGIDVKGFDWYKTDNADDGDYFKRIGGDTRYDTMKKIVEAYNDYTDWGGITILGGRSSKDVWTYHSTAVLASGDNFPDALAANGLAGYLTNEKLSVGKGENTDAVPVILTKAGTLSSQAKDLLKNMQVQNVIIMGGTAAVSQDVEDAIAKMGIGTQRVAGADRQETSLKALQRINGNWNGRKGTYDLIIATGDNYADALSISPYAYRMGTPVILTKKDGTLTDEQVAAIKANDKILEIVIVGGTEAVSDQVMGQIGTLRNNGASVRFTRLAGADRYETSAKIAEFEVAAWTDYYNSFWTPSKKWDKYFDNASSVWTLFGIAPKFSFDHVVVATGENFPDALAGGQLAGGRAFKNVDGFEDSFWNPCPLLLTKDGNNQAERTIEAQIAKKGITVNDDYFFTEDSWDAYVAANYVAGSTVYKALSGKWYTYATNWTDADFGWTYGKEEAFNVFPFYISLEGIKNVGPAGTTTTKPFNDDVEISYDVVLNGSASTSNIVVENEAADYDDKVITSVKHAPTPDAPARFEIKYLDAKKNEQTAVVDVSKGTFVDSAGEIKSVEKLDNWSTVESHTFTVNFQWEEEVSNADVSDYIIRYVAQDENFYGIILGGTSAVSNKKRDSLDDAVEATASTKNYLDDSITWGKDKDYRIYYNKLVYLRTDAAGVDYFMVAGTGDTVTHDAINGWTYIN